MNREDKISLFRSQWEKEKLPRDPNTPQPLREDLVEMNYVSSPQQEETFNHMFEIIDTNRLTHELTLKDWEVLDSIPDLPVAPPFTFSKKEGFNPLWRERKKRK